MAYIYLLPPLFVQNTKLSLRADLQLQQSLIVWPNSPQIEPRDQNQSFYR